MISVGGARIGWVNATWPFAILTVQRDLLVLNATLIGKYSFRPEQVVAIERYSIIPFLGWGIRIQHNDSTYPKKIVYWCLGSPGSLLRRIRDSGFVPMSSPDAVQVGRGLPVRWQSIVAMVLLWNALGFLDMYTVLGRLTWPATWKPGIFALLALLLMFTGSLAIWRSRVLQYLILRPGHSCSEIKAWLYLLAEVSCGLLIFFTYFSFVGRNQ